MYADCIICSGKGEMQLKNKRARPLLYGGKTVGFVNTKFCRRLVLLSVCIIIACAVILLQMWKMKSLRDGAPVGRQVLLDVPFISQRDKYPNACESVSSVMALQYFGVPISVEEFVGQYLTVGIAPYTDADGIRRGCNPWCAFPGNPCDKTGWGCYAPVISKALKSIPLLEDFEILELYDLPISELCSRYIDQAIPVILWATIDMQEPRPGVSWNILGTDEAFTWISPMHCLLLTGYDDIYYYFMDPLEKKDCRYSKDSVETAYAGMYRQAVVILKKGA